MLYMDTHTYKNILCTPLKQVKKNKSLLPKKSCKIPAFLLMTFLLLEFWINIFNSENL